MLFEHHLQILLAYIIWRGLELFRWLPRLWRVDEASPRPLVHKFEVTHHVGLLVDYFFGGFLPGYHLLVQLLLQNPFFLFDGYCLLEHLVVCPLQNLLCMHLCEHVALVNIMEALQELVLN